MIDILSLDQFEMSCLITVDAAVDTPVSIDTVWSGNPSLSDSPRVTISPATEEPYISTVRFTSLKPTDFGEYQVAVQVNPKANGDSRVHGSSESVLNFTLLASMHITFANKKLNFICFQLQRSS